MNSWTLLENAAVVLAILYVILLGRKQIAGWPVGLASSSMFLAYWLHSADFGQALLSIVYLVAGLIGWRKWYWADQCEGRAIPHKETQTERQVRFQAMIDLRAASPGLWKCVRCERVGEVPMKCAHGPCPMEPVATQNGRCCQ